MKILGLIPARAGSERIPYKNTVNLGGKPLIRWTIDEAKKFNFDYLAVTTDDPNAASVAKQVGCEVILRPPELARPETPMLPVVQHAAELIKADLIILLQPTSPFRTVDDIWACYEIATSRNADSVVSMTEVQEDMVFELGHANRARPAAKLVVPNGAVYILTAEELARRGNWYTGLMYAYMMPKERSIDVDTNFDLEMARYMIEQGRVRAA
jgi:CMP-N,N'-diacetyllegionaminic acid synthase